MGQASTSGYSKFALVQWYLEGSKLYSSKGFELASKSFRNDDIVDMTGKIVVITGANKGLGYAAATAIAKLNADVHLVCRDEVRGNQARESIMKETNNQRVFLHQCDLSSYAGIRGFAQKFTAEIDHVDVLINNAGCMPSELTMSEEGNEVITATAIGGTHLLTDLLVPALKKCRGRVINVSSGGAYSVRANPLDLYCSKIAKYDGTLFYAFAKRVQIILTEMWAQRLKDSGVVVHAMHPGWATTEGVLEAMPGFHEQNQASFRTVEQGADTIVFLAANNASVPNKTGLFWFDRHPVRTNMPLGGTDSSESDRQLLWKVCSETVGGISNA